MFAAAVESDTVSAGVLRRRPCIGPCHEGAEPKPTAVRSFAHAQFTETHSALKSLAVGVLAAGALAIGNHVVAWRTERRHPPEGAFIEVDGVRLHYSDRGQGSPVMLIHGNAVTGADWNTSGVADLLLESHRVIIFDRPGLGYSDRPRGQIWTADRQADLLHKAVRQLGVERPVVVGHSWGSIVALALATRYQAELSGFVLLSGYYFCSPLLGWLQMPLIKWQMFSPKRVPSRFQAEYSTGMALRPAQIRATAEDGALMIPGALALRGHYKDLRLPSRSPQAGTTALCGRSGLRISRRRSRAARCGSSQGSATWSTTPHPISWPGRSRPSQAGPRSP